MRRQRGTPAEVFADPAFRENGLVISEALRARTIYSYENDFRPHKFEEITSTDAQSAIQAVCTANDLAWYTDEFGTTHLVDAQNIAQLPKLVVEAQLLDRIRNSTEIETYGCLLDTHLRLKSYTFQGDLQDLDLFQTIELLQTFAHVGIRCAEMVSNIPAPAMPHFEPAGVSALDVLEQICKKCDLVVAAREGGTLFVEKSTRAHSSSIWKALQLGEESAEECAVMNRTLFVSGRDLSLRDIADTLGRELSLPVLLDEESWECTTCFDLNCGGRTVRGIVDSLSLSTPVRVRVRLGRLTFLHPLPAR